MRLQQVQSPTQLADTLLSQLAQVLPVRQALCVLWNDSDSTLLAVSRYGGAGASIGSTKQRRLVYAARHYLARLPQCPPCRFDVVLVQGGGAAATLEWLPAAFDASGWD